MVTNSATSHNARKGSVFNLILKTLIESEDFTFSNNSFPTEGDAALKMIQKLLVYMQIYTKGLREFERKQRTGANRK